MLRFLLVVCILFNCLLTIGQVPDFISVKKRNGITVRNYYAGGWPITFKATDGRIYEGPIDKIENDSLYLKFYQVNIYQTIWGTSLYDTVNAFSIPFHYKQIQHVIIPTVKKRAGYLATLGKMMMWGGYGYSVLNVVNGGLQKQPLADNKNIKNLAIAMGTGFVGTILKSSYGNPYRNSKRYKIVYVNMH